MTIRISKLALAIALLLLALGVAALIYIALDDEPKTLGEAMYQERQQELEELPTCEDVNAGVVPPVDGKCRD